MNWSNKELFAFYLKLNVTDNLFYSLWVQFDGLTKNLMVM